ncbi:MAG: hypothetical protein ABW199_01910 [Caulobacterales bacterium]
MRHWTFHPLFLYPCMAAIAIALILLSLRPDFALGAPAPQVGRVNGGAVILQGAALSQPEVQPDEVVHVLRDSWGRPSSIRIAVLPNQPAPGPADTGVRFLLDPQTAAAVAGKPVTLEITLRPVFITSAASLAASLQGAGPAEWKTQEVSPQAQIVRFDFPSVEGLQAVGLRPISNYADYNYGFEIVRIRIAPNDTASGR